MVWAAVLAMAVLAANRVRAVLATAPITLAGLTAKARWAAGSDLPDAAVASALRRVVDDVVAMSERSGVAS